MDIAVEVGKASSWDVVLVGVRCSIHFGHSLHYNMAVDRRVGYCVPGHETGSGSMLVGCLFRRYISTS